MQRSRTIRLIITLLSIPLALLVIAGCSHHTQNAASPPAVILAPPNQSVAGQPAAFQPYTLLPSPPPAPPVVTHRHRVLHLTRLHDRVYLVDNDRHLYEADRDAQCHVYPVYRDPVTHTVYPLYYDARRDNLYRAARNDDGRFYRNYVGQPTDRFYAMEQDPQRFRPSDRDRPIVTDSYNTYNDSTYNYGNRYPGGSGYRPPLAHHAGHHNNDWLWAIPVIVGAYFLLQPYHHSSPPPRSAGPTTVIVRQTTPVTIINQAVPPVSRPVYAPPPPPHVGDDIPQRSVAYRPAAVHHTRFVPFARPASAASPRRTAQARPPLPAPRVLPRVAVAAPSIRPRPVFRRAPIATHPVRTTAFRRPAAFPAPHPFRRPEVRPALAAAVPHTTVHRSIAPPVVRVTETPRMIVRPQAVRPHPAVHVQPVAPVRPVAELHRELSAPRREQPRVEQPRVEQPAASRPAPLPRPAEVRETRTPPAKKSAAAANNRHDAKKKGLRTVAKPDH